jgi:predicted nucleic acid-binding protein
VIFLDTGFLFALVSRRDAHHPRVVEVFRTFKDLRRVDHLLTTNHVIAETITLTRKIGHEDAARLGDQLYGERLARIHWASPDEERAAFDYFKRHQDQTYSAVDCLSFVVMEKLGIHEALASTRTSRIGSSHARDHSEAEATASSS